jgi:membrane carboxypeptidase/penicillin-binding protein
MVTVAWFGFDTYKTLGHNQMGGDLALPMWVRFMRVALKGVPEYKFPAPSGGHTKKTKVNSKGATTTDFEYYPSNKQEISVDTGDARYGKHPTPPKDAKKIKNKHKQGSSKSPVSRSMESLF